MRRMRVATSSRRRRAPTSAALGERHALGGSESRRRRERISFGARTTASRESIAAVKDLLRSPPPATLAAPWSLQGGQRVLPERLEREGGDESPRVDFFLGCATYDDRRRRETVPRRALSVGKRAAPGIIEPFDDGSASSPRLGTRRRRRNRRPPRFGPTPMRGRAGSLRRRASVVFHANDFRLAFAR